MSATNFSSFALFCSKSLTALIKSCPWFFLICLKILFQTCNFITKLYNKFNFCSKKVLQKHCHKIEWVWFCCNLFAVFFCFSLYTITDKDVDKNTLMLRMSFHKLRFCRSWFCSSVSITKRTILHFSLHMPFRVDTLTLANVAISCSFLHNFINAMSATNFSSFVFFVRNQ